MTERSIFPVWRNSQFIHCIYASENDKGVNRLKEQSIWAYSTMSSSASWTRAMRSSLPAVVIGTLYICCFMLCPAVEYKFQSKTHFEYTFWIWRVTCFSRKQKTYLRKSVPGEHSAHLRNLIRILSRRILDGQGCKFSSCRQRRIWSDCAEGNVIQIINGMLPNFHQATKLPSTFLWHKHVCLELYSLRSTG